MLLTIDSGNTKLKAKYFLQNGEIGQTYSVEKGRINHLLDELSGLEIKNIIFVDSGGFENKIENAVYSKFGTVPFNVKLLQSFPFEISYGQNFPGMDRLVAIMGAISINEKVKESGVIVTMGTCNTFNAIINGVFKFGFISPGIKMRFNSMHQSTSGLPLISIQDDFMAEITSGGTQQNMINGVMFGIKAEISMAISTIFGSQNIPVFLTGGNANRFKNNFPSHFQNVEDLSFLGLEYIFKQTQNK